MGTDGSQSDELRQLRERLNPLDEPDLINIFKTSFIELIKKNHFDLIITHKGKGSNFFNFLMDSPNIPHKSDLFIQDLDIKNKRLLLFDDAIKTGSTIEKKINEILNKSPSKLTVACLLTTNSGLEKINKNSFNGKYDFKPLGLIIPDKLYDHIYQRFFFPLIGKMDYHLEEYPEFVMEIKSTNNLNFKKLCRIIETKLISDADDKYEVPFLTDHININKYTIHFDKFPLNFAGPINSEILLSKIRMWIYFNDTSKIMINIKPIVHLYLKEDIEKCVGSYDFCFKDKMIKIEHLCQTCMTYLYCSKLGDFFYKKMGQELTNLNLEWEAKERPPYEKYKGL